ncbi:hypothetical protein BA896_003045 [Janthinobacterium lividum]|uniref:Uncharacterized protein n=1 Tax=Janthinobacterium lividum TaxID=29581 RepID=A0A1E8PQS5_9BURK|nr:hypothetical protein BA896_003045 [Janthinobacterium lividum]
MITDNEKEGMDSGVSEAPFDHDPVLTQYQNETEQEKWQRGLEACRKERKSFNEEAVKSLNRYGDVRKDGFANSSMYNIYFMNTDIKLAALYAKTPKPDIKRRNDDSQDDVSRVAALILQRNLSYEMDNCNFDDTFKQVLFDNVVAGIGVSWLRLEQDEQSQPDVFDHMTGMSMPQPSLVTHQEACTDYVAWDDFFWSPCKVWSMCSWVARRIPMTKDAIKARFGDKVDAAMLREITYSTKSEAQDSGKAKLSPQNQTEPTADVYEIWDKQRELIFWITETSPVPLDVQEDTTNFDGFYPTPMPPLGRFTTSNTIPISDYHLVKGKYAELDELNQRSTALTKAMGVRFVYDAASPEIKELYTTVSENSGIGVKNWASFAGDKGGLAGSIQFAPLDQIANTSAIATQQIERIKAQIYEVEGISDIMRGQATPYETATATTAKSQQSFGRFADRQADVANYAAKLLRLKAHLMCKFHDPNLMVKRAMPLSPADQQFIGPALQLLQDDQMSSFLLSVSVDSLQLDNWNTEKSERSEAIHSITGLMSQILPAVQHTPELAPFALEMIRWAVSGFKGAQPVAGMIDQSLQQLMTAKQQGEQGAPKPPSHHEAKAQAITQKAQMDFQTVQLQEQTKMQIAQMQAQLKQMELQLEQQQNERDNQMRETQVQLRQGELAAKVAHEQATAMLDHTASLMNATPPFTGQ